MKDENLINLFTTFIENYSVDEIIDLLPDERSKKIGLILHTKGYQDAMKKATKELDRL